MFMCSSSCCAGQRSLLGLLLSACTHAKGQKIMAYDNIAAEVIGGMLSGLRYVKQGWLMVFQVALTGATLAHFVGADIARLVLQYSGVAISYGAILFLVSYLGPTALDRANMFIKAFQVSKLWNQKK
jgi:hypothetical protein